MMKINSKILSIPPYISTSWDNVAGVFMDQEAASLVISLKSSQKVSIPNLEPRVLEEVFSAHAEYMEKNTPNNTPDAFLGNLQGALRTGAPGGAPLDLENIGSFTGMMQHDPAQKDAADLPKEILERVSQVAKALGLDQENFEAPDSEPHCNCPYCQIARAMHGDVTGETKEAPEQVEEIVPDTELKFREWDINEVAEKLFEVSNPFDKSEHYQVYLGQPIGCTCGKNNCEHIIAVLNS